MNASKLIVSSVAALSVVGALTIANAQMSTSPGTAQGDTSTQMNNNRTPQDNGSTVPNTTMNNNTTGGATAPATTVDNAPVANDPTLPAQADRN